MSSQAAVAVLSRDEIDLAIRSFTPAQWARLKFVAKRYAFGRPIDPDDLFQEAFARALDTRQCPADLDVLTFLIGTMRSIVSGEAQKAKKHPTVVMSAVVDEQGEPVDYPDLSPSAENNLIDEENAALVRRNVLALFDDDPDAQVIVEGEMDGWSAEELRAYTGLSQTAYDSKRRLIRRRLNKAYPGGWKP